MKGGLMGERRETTLNGEKVVVLVIEVEQDSNNRNHGKYRCRNYRTGRVLHRTERQLHPIPSYAPGGSKFYIGDRVRYVGKPRTFHEGQEAVQTGATGTVVKDFGWNYRYLILLDKPVGDRRTHYGGIEFDIRPSNVWSDWEGDNNAT